MIYNETKYNEEVGKKPQKRDFYQYWVYSKGKVLLERAKEKEYIDFRTNNVVDFDSFIVEKEYDDDKFKNAMADWKNKHVSFMDEYKQEVFDVYSYSDLSDVNEIIWQKAWDNSHSEGYRAVEEEFNDLVYFVGNIVDQLRITTNG